MTGDFNIRDCRWNPYYPFHSIHSDSLFDIADFFSLDISNPIENVPTRFSDNDHNTNSVLDLVFLFPSFPEFNQHCIHPEWRLSSDHAPITIDVFIREERISHSWCSLAKGSNEKIKFIKNMNTSSFQNTENLKEMNYSSTTHIQNWGILAKKLETSKNHKTFQSLVEW